MLIVGCDFRYVDVVESFNYVRFICGVECFEFELIVYFVFV